jgi:hypothetical protein
VILILGFFMGALAGLMALVSMQVVFIARIDWAQKSKDVSYSQQ